MVSCLLIFFAALCIYHCAWVCFRRNIFYTIFTTGTRARGFFRLVEAIFIFVGPLFLLGLNMFLMSKVMGTASSVQSFFGKADWTAGWLEASFVILDLLLIWILVVLWLGIDTVWSSRSIAVSDEPTVSAALRVSDVCCEVWVRIACLVDAFIPKKRARRRRVGDGDPMNSFYALLTVVKIAGPSLAIVLYSVVPNHNSLVAYYVSGGVASAVCLSAVLASVSGGTGKVMFFLDQLGDHLEDRD